MTTAITLVGAALAVLAVAASYRLGRRARTVWEVWVVMNPDRPGAECTRWGTQLYGSRALAETVAAMGRNDYPYMEFDVSPVRLAP